MCFLGYSVRCLFRFLLTFFSKFVIDIVISNKDSVFFAADEETSESCGVHEGLWQIQPQHHLQTQLHPGYGHLWVPAGRTREGDHIQPVSPHMNFKFQFGNFSHYSPSFFWTIFILSFFPKKLKPDSDNQNLLKLLKSVTLWIATIT